MAIAEEAWGTVPDWIKALIAECDRTSQTKAASRLGRSTAVISQALRQNYPGNMIDLERRVRAILCPEQVDCPAQGFISSADCLGWQDTALKGLNSASPLTVRMFRACQGCARFNDRSS